MNRINNNPYRIVGIYANASVREIERQKGKIKKFASVGKPIESDLDFPFLTAVERSETTVSKAFSEIEQNQGKVTHALFWFLNANPLDETALNYLINGDKEKALEIWGKVTDGKEITNKNFSCFNNIATLHLLSGTKTDIQQGIKTKMNLIQSDSFTDFVYLVADQTFRIDKKKQLENFAEELLSAFKKQFSNSELVDLFSDCDTTVKQYVSRKFIDEYIYAIESHIEQSKKKRTADKANAAKTGEELYNCGLKELWQLKSIVSANDLKYTSIADKLANEILQCSIDYFNYNKEKDSSENYFDPAMKLAKSAEGVATGHLAKDRIKDSLKTLEEMKDNEISQAIALLKSVKEAYETNKMNIMLQVKRQEATLVWGQSINWSKVNEMIENSLDWNKVVGLILQVIPPKNIEKIRNVQNTTKINEYKNLVDFLMDKLNYSYKRKVKYLCYWKTISTTTTSSHTNNSNQSNWFDENMGCIIPLIIVLIVGLITMLV